MAMMLENEFTVPVPIDQAWAVLLDVERVAPCMPGAVLDSAEGEEFSGRMKVKVGPITVTYKGTVRFLDRDDDAHTVTIEGSGKESRGAGTASGKVRAQLHDEGDKTRVSVSTTLNVTGRPAQFGRNVLAEVSGKLVGRFADCLAEQLAAGERPAAGPAGAVSSAGSPAESSTPPGGTTTGTQDTPAGSGAGAGASAAAAGTAAGTAASAPIADTVTTGPAAAPAREPSFGAARSRPGEDAIDLLDVAGVPVLKRVGPVLAVLVIVLMLARRRRRRRRRARAARAAG